MTTPEDISNKNRRRVLTIKSNRFTQNSTNTSQNTTTNAHNKHDNVLQRNKSQSFDVFEEKKKIKDLSRLSNKSTHNATLSSAIVSENKPLEEDNKVVVNTNINANINENSNKKDKTLLQNTSQNNKRIRKPVEVNFDQDSKKKLRNLDRQQDTKPDSNKQDINLNNQNTNKDRKEIISNNKENKEKDSNKQHYHSKDKQNNTDKNNKKPNENKALDSNKTPVTSTPSPKNITAIKNDKKKFTQTKITSYYSDEEEKQTKKAKNKTSVEKFKLSVINLAKIENDDDVVFVRSRKKKLQQKVVQEKIKREITIGEAISVNDLAIKLTEKGAVLIKCLMKMGMIVTLNQVIDGDTAELVATELGHKVTRVTKESIMHALIGFDDTNLMLEKRPPVVTVMGHVDHGKTSLLDALRKTDVVAKEHGGITQHIGAYQVHLSNNNCITFLDTPGHEAFSAMRIRGAKITDIIVLIVAADDGIKAQTIEAISHAKAAGVPIIVAINKMDKPTANFENVKNSLLQYDIIPDDMGGDVMVVGISAATGYGLNNLIEAILLQAELLHLKASNTGRAKGYVIEARLDKIKGFTASLLVQSGQLNTGDIVVAGQTFGKIRSMFNDKGEKITVAGPATPVEITGMDQVPIAGDEFVVMQNEKSARELVIMLSAQAKDIVAKAEKPKTLQEMFSDNRDDIKEIAIIVKADVHGSTEAIIHSLNKIQNSEVKIKIVHYGAGGINESDVMLAAASKALIIGFNVRPNSNAKDTATKIGVEMRFYSIIYNLLDDIKALVSNALSPIESEEIIGLVEIRKIFDTSKYGKIAGCYVKEGIVKRNSLARLLRDNSVIYTGSVQSLKRQKDDTKEVKEGFECGITLDNYDDIRIGDQVEIFAIISKKQTL